MPRGIVTGVAFDMSSIPDPSVIEPMFRAWMKKRGTKEDPAPTTRAVVIRKTMTILAGSFEAAAMLSRFVYLAFEADEKPGDKGSPMAFADWFGLCGLTTQAAIDAGKILCNPRIIAFEHDGSSYTRAPLMTTASHQHTTGKGEDRKTLKITFWKLDKAAFLIAWHRLMHELPAVDEAAFQKLKKLNGKTRELRTQARSTKTEPTSSNHAQCIDRNHAQCIDLSMHNAGSSAMHNALTGTMHNAAPFTGEENRRPSETLGGEQSPPKKDDLDLFLSADRAKYGEEQLVKPQQKKEFLSLLAKWGEAKTARAIRGFFATDSKFVIERRHSISAFLDTPDQWLRAEPKGPSLRESMESKIAEMEARYGKTDPAKPA
ncbi:MAG: hypothetical protein JWQ02_1034 [Capsulimonas sp.]|nr:hypothetical protein [Capsulimonas sp.]